MNVGDRIKRLREAAGLSKGRLAEKADLSPSYIGQLEAKIKQPTVEVISRICAALGITLAEFFAEDTQGMPPDIRQLVREAEGLTPEQRRKLIEFIKSMKA